jgi:cysteine desulfurase/selenocysteine lyase
MNAGPLDVRAIRRHFSFPRLGRIATNNAASTQPPRELLDLCQSLAPRYENVHRGQSRASVEMTALFEASYDTIAEFIGAPGRASIAVYRNATEAINAVMYSLLTEVRDGDNVVTTMMEHNSNYVPWHGLCREILPRLGRRAECRLARFDPVTGELDLGHLASLIDARTKLVCCSGASNFLGTRTPLAAVRALADASGYVQPDGERRSRLLVDAAQLVPGSYVDVQHLGADYLAFSFHKMLAPFGTGVLYAREHLLAGALPFLYGGDMIAEGRVFPHHVDYNALPWKYAAGTPNILGTIISAQALRLLLDLALTPKQPAYFRTGKPIESAVVADAMTRGAPHVPGRVQPGRPGPGRGGRSPGPGGDRIPRGLPLCDAGPSRARADPARQLPSQLLPLQHPGRGRSGHRRGGRHRRRPAGARRPLVPAARPPGVVAPGPAARPGGTGMTSPDSTARGWWQLPLQSHPVPCGGRTHDRGRPPGGQQPSLTSWEEPC